MTKRLSHLHSTDLVFHQNLSHTNLVSFSIQSTRRKRGCVRSSDHPALSFTPYSQFQSSISSSLENTPFQMPAPATNKNSGHSNQSIPVNNVMNDNTITSSFSPSQSSSFPTTDNGSSLGVSFDGSCLPSSSESLDFSNSAASSSSLCSSSVGTRSVTDSDTSSVH